MSDERPASGTRSSWKRTRAHKVRKTKTLQKHCFGAFQRSLLEPSEWDAELSCWEMSALPRRGNRCAPPLVRVFIWGLRASTGSDQSGRKGTYAFQNKARIQLALGGRGWWWGGGFFCVADSEKKKKRKREGEVKAKDASLCLEPSSSSLKSPSITWAVPYEAY